MDAADVIRRLHDHRAWVNHNLLAAARQLSGEKLQQEFPIGQGSLWQSLCHMYAAEYVWLAALTGTADAVCPGDVPGALVGNQRGEGAMTSLDELQRNWTALEQRWTAYLDAIQPAALDEPVTKKSPVADKSCTTARRDVLLHVCTHAHYTAAQAVNMLRHLGASKLPEVMLIALARQEQTQG